MNIKKIFQKLYFGVQILILIPVWSQSLPPEDIFFQCLQGCRTLMGPFDQTTVDAKGVVHLAQGYLYLHRPAQKAVIVYRHGVDMEVENGVLSYQDSVKKSGYKVKLDQTPLQVLFQAQKQKGVKISLLNPSLCHPCFAHIPSQSRLSFRIVYQDEARGYVHIHFLRSWKGWRLLGWEIFQLQGCHICVQGREAKEKSLVHEGFFNNHEHFDRDLVQVKKRLVSN